MFNAVERLIAVLAVVGLVGTLGCQQRQEVEDEGEGGADTLTMSEPAGGAAGGAADTAMGAGAGEEIAVSVTNTMPHAMVVTVDLGQGTTELGTLAPNETRNFPVQGATAGTQATLTATDSAATHSVSGTVDVSPGTAATWTIQ